MKRNLTLLLALVAMFMGTLRVNAISPNDGAVIAEKDFTGGFEGNYPNWYMFGEGQDGSISSDPDGVAITVGSKTGQFWDPQVMLINEEIQLREGGNYKVVVTAKFPCNGQLQINMGSWAGNEQYPVDVVSTGEFQEVEINFLDYRYDCNNSGGVGDAHVLFLCGNFLGTTIVKKIQVWDLDAGPYAVLSGDGKTLTFYCDGNKSTYATSNVYDLNEGRNAPEWQENTTIETVVFDETFKNARPTTTCQWFYGLTSLSSIVNIENLNTSEVTDMNGMFLQCTSLKGLDLSHFDTSKVIDMGYMFSICTSLESLDLSNFNTSKVDNMYYMFDSCSQLETLDISNFDTSNVTNMGSMFGWCTSLQALDLSSFNTSKVTTMNSMFAWCTNLQGLDLKSFNTARVVDMMEMFCNCHNLSTIIVANAWNTNNVTSSDNMFFKCESLVGGAGTEYDGSYLNKEYARIDGLNGQSGYLTAGPKEAYAVYDSQAKTLTFNYDMNKSTYGENAYDLNEENCAPGWIDYDNPKEIQKVVFTSSFQNARPVSTYDWFFNQPSLTEIVDIKYLNTSLVEYMSEMFYNCSSLTNLDLSGFDTQNVIDMSLMFSGCKGLTSLNLRSFNTSNVRNMNCMFNACDNLKTITVGTKWNTENVESSDEMFLGCTKLVGGAGTKYDGIHYGKEYAIADGLNGNPGYLTAVSYGITVSGKAVTFANKYDVLDNETVYYDDALNILTLHNANVTSINIASTAPNDLHVNVIGECKVRHASTNGNAFTTSIAKTTIEGVGKLTIISLNGIGIRINRSRTAALLVKDVDLEVAGYQAGIAGSKDLNNKFCSNLVFDNTNCKVGSLQGETESVVNINGLECIRCSMTAGEFDKVNHKVAANPMIIQRSGGISTDIDAIDNGQLTMDKSLPLYNLNGQRVSHPVKGQIYIQNGRKIKF